MNHTLPPVKRLTHTPGAPALYLFPMVSGDVTEGHRDHAEWCVDFYGAEVARYEANPNDPLAVAADRHLRHWRRVLAAIDAFEGVAA